MFGSALGKYSLPKTRPAGRFRRGRSRTTLDRGAHRTCYHRFGQHPFLPRFFPSSELVAVELIGLLYWRTKFQVERIPKPNHAMDDSGKVKYAYTLGVDELRTHAANRGLVTIKFCVSHLSHRTVRFLHPPPHGRKSSRQRRQEANA